MAFKPNIPQPNDFLDQSQIDLLGDMQQLDASFLINHYTFSDTTGKTGKHRFVEMPVTTVFPAQVPTSAGEGSVFTFTSGQSQLYYTPDGGNQGYQLTRCIDTNIGKFSTSTNYAGNVVGGWTFLPGGMLLNYGFITLAANATPVTVAFAQPYTSATEIYITLGKVTADTSQTGQEVRIITGSVTTAQFQVLQSSSSSANKAYFMAIGK